VWIKAHPHSSLTGVLEAQVCLACQVPLEDWFCFISIVATHFPAFLPQVHFVPDPGTVAQIVYTDDQVRPPQQVVYTADGASYTSVDGPEHTLVYIHPVEAAQAREGLFAFNLCDN
jgi:hypothetical protein